MTTQLVKKILQINIKRCSAPFAQTQNRNLNTSGSSKEFTNVTELEKTPDDENAPGTVIVSEPVNISCVTGIPEEHIKGRLVRIYQTPKNAMQSGTENSDHWEMEFETRMRWENPLMGWSSTGDPLSNMKLQFLDENSAMAFANKYGYEYYIEGPNKVKPKTKSYGFNFSWNRRTRVSTK